MKNFILAIFLSCSVLRCKSYDIFEGFVLRSSFCFETTVTIQCNITLADAFTPPHKGVDINRYDTKVFLFTRKNPEKGEPLHNCGGKLPPNTEFNPQIETIVLIHGWFDGVCQSAWMREMMLQFFKRGAYNIVLIDWTWGNGLDFAGAELNSITVGEQIGFVVKNIMIQNDVDGSKFHFIGHGLGVLSVAHAAKFIKKWKRQNKIRRVTGLEPSIAPYTFGPQQMRLSYTDAKFVDVYHTRFGPCTPFRYGNDVGHANFFVNGGELQPACVLYIVYSLLKGDYIYAIASLVPTLCRQLHSIQYFKVSISPPNGKFIGVRCENYEDFLSGACKRCCNETGYDCAVAGMDAELYFPHKDQPTEPRKYFFHTGLTCPYDEDYKFSIYKDC